MGDSIARKLAQFSNGAKFDSLPEGVVEKMKMLILDLVGVGVLGVGAPWSRSVVEVAESLGGEGQASYFHGPRKVSAPLAALINGTMAHSYDFDDVHDASATHPGAAVIPAALAAGEMGGASGRELILSVVAGYEVMIRLAEALNPDHLYKRGFHPTAICGVFGAATASAKLMGLPVEGVVHALGVGGSQASGLIEFLSDGSWTKRLHPGKAAMEGLLAALLARAGFTGPSTVFEGRDGVLHAYSEGADPSKLIEGLGEGYKTLEVSLKPYPCCRFNHAPIDVLLSLMARGNLEAKDIAQLKVATTSWAARVVSEPPGKKRLPKTILEAQMSLPYAVALAAFGRGGELDGFDPGRPGLDAVRELAGRVEAVSSSALDEEARLEGEGTPAIVEIVTRDGRILTERRLNAKGDPKAPLSLREVEGKFMGNVAGGIEGGRAKKIIEMIRGLEDLDDVRGLMELLRK